MINFFLHREAYVRILTIDILFNVIINNLDLRISDFVNVFLVSHFYHEPPAREIGQPLPVYLTVNKLYLYTFHYRCFLFPTDDSC